MKSKFKLIATLLCLALFTLMALGSGSDADSSDSKNSSSSSSETTTKKEETTVNLINGGTLASEKTNLSLKNVVKDSDFYVGLLHIKKGSTFTYMNTAENVPSGYDAIYAFFEVYNAGSNLKSISESDFEIYADSQLVDGIETYMVLTEDNVSQHGSYALDPNTKALVLIDGQAKQGWQTLDVFYGNYSWHFTSDQVSEEAYDNTLIIDENIKRDLNQVGDEINCDAYKIVYDGFTTKDREYAFSDDSIIFMYTITNLTEDTIDLGLCGYEMRAYANNISLGDATYTVDDTIDGHLNIYNVDELKPNMSAQIYIAFDSTVKTGTFYNVLDMGFIASDVVGSINVEIQ